MQVLLRSKERGRGFGRTGPPVGRDSNTHTWCSEYILYDPEIPKLWPITSFRWGGSGAKVQFRRSAIDNLGVK